LLTNKINKAQLKIVSYLSADKVIRLISEVFVGGYIAQYLTPTYFGIWQYCFSLTVIFGVLASAGLTNTVIVRELSSGRVDKKELVSGSIFTKLIMGFLSICFIYIYFITFETSNLKGLEFYLIILFSTRFCLQAFDPVDYLFQFQQVPHKPVIIKIIIAIIFIPLKLIFVKYGLSIIGFGYLYIVELLLYYISLYYIGYLKYEFRLKFVSLTIIKNLISKGLPLIISAALVALYFRIDQVMIKWYLGDEKVGIYAAAARISEIWYAIPTIVLTIMTPKLMSYKLNSHKLYANSIVRIYLLLILIALICSCFVYIFSDGIISIIYGSEYQYSASILRIHIFSSIFVFMAIFNSTILIIENLTKWTIITSLANAASNIALNIILIPKFGVIGSAYSVLFSYIISISFFIIILNVKRKNEIRSIRLRSLFKS
jgi:O-antigen/teichoic acid export membrane protein